jgi:hypothetical protein
LRRFAVFFQNVHSGFIGLQVITAVLHFSHQVDQRFEHVIQADHSMGHAGTADLMTQALKHVL